MARDLEGQTKEAELLARLDAAHGRARAVCRIEAMQLEIDDMRSERDAARAELATLRAPVGDAEAWGRVLYEIQRKDAGIDPATGRPWRWEDVSDEGRTAWTREAVEILSRYHAALVTAATKTPALNAAAKQDGKLIPAFANIDFAVLAAYVRAALTHARAVVAPGVGEESKDEREYTGPTQCIHGHNACPWGHPTLGRDPITKRASREDAVKAVFDAFHAAQSKGLLGMDVARYVADAALALHPDIAGIVWERDKARRDLQVTRNALIEERGLAEAEAARLRAELEKGAETVGALHEQRAFEVAETRAEIQGLDAEAKRLGAELAEVESCRAFAVDSAAKAEAAVTQLRAELAAQCDYKGALDTIREKHLGMPPWADGAEKTADAVARVLDVQRGEIGRLGAELAAERAAHEELERAVHKRLEAEPPLPVTGEAMRHEYATNRCAPWRSNDADQERDLHTAGLTAVARLVVAAVRAGGATITLEECGAYWDSLTARETYACEDGHDLARWYLTTAIERACPAGGEREPLGDTTLRSLLVSLFGLPPNVDRRTIVDCVIRIKTRLERIEAFTRGDAKPFTLPERRKGDDDITHIYHCVNKIAAYLGDR